MKVKPFFNRNYVNIIQSPLSPQFFKHFIFLLPKKREGKFVLSDVYARFLNVITVRTPTIAITIITAIAEARTYVIKSPVVAMFV